MIFKHFLRSVCLLSAATLSAAEIPVEDKTGTRVHAKDEDVRVDSEYKELYEQQLSANEELKRLVDIKEQATAPKEESIFEPPPEPQPNSTPSFSNEVTRPRTLPSGIQVFGATKSAGVKTTVLPAGSFVKARLLTGVQANSRYAYESLLQLDYAYTGPNGAKIPLQGCMVITDAKADLSIERVVMAPHTLSCVMENGEHFDRGVKGFVAGSDSANGLEGVYLSKQNKVFLAALLASIVKGAGEAVQMSNIEEQVSGAEHGAVARNFKGNVTQFAVAKGLTDAGGMVADWYLEQAKALLPTIGVASGAEVWVVMTKTVEIPDLGE